MRKIKFILSFCLFLGLFYPMSYSAQYKSSYELVDYTEPNAYKEYTHEKTEGADSTINERYSTIKEKYKGNQFNYTEEKLGNDTYWHRLQQWISNFLESIIPDFNEGTINAIYRVLIIVIIAIAIYVIYKLIINKTIYLRRKEETDDENNLQFIEKNLLTIDIDQYIQQAKSNNKWNLAIRYLHLKNLQKLAQNNLIEWDHRKTNLEIQQEIKSEKLRQGFTKTNKLFNYIWFGDFQLTESEFEGFQNDFIHFNKEIE